MQFLVIIDAICDHNRDESKGEEKHYWLHLTVLAASRQQQETEDQDQRRQGISRPDDLASYRVCSLEDRRTQHKIPAKSNHSHHDDQAVKENTYPRLDRQWSTGQQQDGQQHKGIGPEKAHVGPRGKEHRQVGDVLIVRPNSLSYDVAQNTQAE